MQVITIMHMDMYATTVLVLMVVIKTILLQQTAINGVTRDT